MTTWNPDLETGHAEIDADHRQLFAQLNDLKTAIDSGAGRERMVDLITILLGYALQHFAREEAHMQRVNCPAITDNIDAHRDFARKLDGWLVLLSTGGMSASIMIDVHREAAAWIEAHILKVDCRLRGCRVP